MNVHTFDVRLDRMEKCIDHLSVQVVTLMESQTETIQALKDNHDEQVESLKENAREQKEGLRRDAETFRMQMLEQATTIAAVSRAIISLQRSIMKYAAAGALAGAVLLYIFAKATGL